MKTSLFYTNKWYFRAGFLCFTCHFFAFCAASYSYFYEMKLFLKDMISITPIIHYHHELKSG